MGESAIEYYGLEDYNFPKGDRPYVICLFKTDRFGIYQVEYQKIGGGWRMKPLPQEPNMHMLTDTDKLYIERICRIVWRLVYNVPAAKNRFE